MEIERLETFTRPKASVTKVHAGGEIGVGQLSPYNADIAAEVFHRQVAPHALGADATEIAGLVQRVLEAEYKFRGTYVRRALTGLDTALWDLRGKIEDEPVCGLLGADPGPIPVYGSSMRRDIDPEEEAARMRERQDRDGFEAFKLRIGKAMGHDEDQWPGRTEGIVPAVREALDDDTDLLVDANGCYTPETAIEVAEFLDEHGVVHFEEPCPFPEIEWTARVREAVDVPVAGGEQDDDMKQWERIVDLPAVDVVQPDIGYVGGLERALRVADLAAEAGLPCVPHSANHSLLLPFTLHMVAAIDNAGPYVEYSIESDWAEGMYEPAPVVEDGRVEVPDGPGWGVEVDPDWLARSNYEVSELG